MRQRLGRIITWAFIIVDSVMVTLGVLYAAGLLAQSTALLSLVEPWALFLSSWLLTLILVQLFLTIVMGLVGARSRRRTLVSDALLDRLQKLGVETLTRMKIDRPMGLSVYKKSSLAFATKNRIYVGDQLLQTAPDDEIAGLIAHEMGHFLRRRWHVIRRIIFWLRVILFLIVFSEVGRSDAGTIIGVTALVAFTLARIPLNWRQEYAADAEAANRLGPSAMVVSLEKLKEANYDGVSFTHPPLSKRIKRLQSMSVLPYTS